MPGAQRTLGLASIVSRQTVPHLEIAAHFAGGNDSGLAKIVLLHTDGEEESKKPAARVERVLRKRFPNVQVEAKQIGLMPADVGQAVAELEADHSVDEWVFNMTGGVKLMPLGLGFAMKADRFRVIYRERESGWLQLSRGSQGISVDTYPVEAGCLERYSPLEVASAQLDLLGNQTVEAEPLPINLPSPQLILAHCRRYKVPIKTALKARMPSDPLPGGRWLEYWVGALLRAAGIRGIQHSMRLVDRTGAGNAQDRQEIDLVFVRKGALHLVDCTARGDAEDRKGPTAQLHEAYSTQRRYGGVAGRYLMYRPSMDRQALPTEFLELLTELGIEFFGPDNVGRPMESLTHWLRGVPPDATEEAKEIDRMVAACLRENIPLYGGGVRSTVQPDLECPFRIDLSHHVTDLIESYGAALIEAGDVRVGIQGGGAGHEALKRLIQRHQGISRMTADHMRWYGAAFQSSGLRDKDLRRLLVPNVQEAHAPDPPTIEPLSEGDAS